MIARSGIAQVQIGPTHHQIAVELHLGVKEQQATRTPLTAAVLLTSQRATIAQRDTFGSQQRLKKGGVVQTFLSRSGNADAGTPEKARSTAPQLVSAIVTR